MGAVYRARDLHFPNVVKRVAVKEMISQVRDPAMRETLVRNFEREANILATLEHPSIPRIYDYFTQNDRSYLIIEFIDGKDLEAMLAEARGYFPEAQVIQWGIELCDVLGFLHDHKPEPIIFRDMKPSNIMINTYNHVMLIDFGIAKTFQVGQKGTMIGTEGYSPPEQYKGEAGPSSDIYALGATLHHLLTRRDPRLEAPFSFNERPIRQLNPTVSIELEAVVNTAIQYNPANRFTSTSEMKDALQNIVRPTGASSSTSKPAGIPAADENIPIDETGKLAWKFECEDDIRGTPTCQNGVLYAGSYDHNLYALDVESGEFIWKYAADGGIVSRPGIHEGTIYFGSEDRRLHAIIQRSGKLSWTYYTNGPIRSSPLIAENHIFIGSDDGFMHAVNSMTGRSSWTTDTGSPVRSTPVIHHDNLYFGTEAGDFYCLDLSGQVKWRFKAKRAITGSAIISQDILFLGSVDATLYALDIKSGFVIWRFRLGKASISTPCLVENLLFTGSVDNTIYCIDKNSTKEIWRFSTDHQVTGSPIIYKDSLYCGSVDKNLYCLEYRTGRLRWNFQTEGPITGTPTAYEDKIYFGSTDHHIYALAI
jgi:outer membrane protein assembly factor BamB/tRNA A-37 threonylcarbamoyl transferase component Bud32